MGLIGRRHLLVGAVISTTILLYRSLHASLNQKRQTIIQTEHREQSVMVAEGSLSKHKPLIKIVMWAPFNCRRLLNLSDPSYLTSRECENSLCEFTADRLQWKDSQGVLFDLRNTREMFKYDELHIPPHHPANQYWILYNQEAMFKQPHLYSLLDSGVYNITASYRHDADVHLPYGECGPRKHGHYRLPEGFPRNKQGLVVWHVSHCTDRSHRMTYVSKLCRHIQVDVFGSCSGNTLEGDQRPRFTDNLSSAAEENINKYKFYLAFENTYCEDYITEKVFKILQDNIYTVPVVRGRGPYENVLPPGSYIDADKFANATELALYLQKLDDDDDLYMEYFKSRSDYQCINHSTDENPWLCRICDNISRMIKAGFTNRLSKARLDDQFLPENNCVVYKNIPLNLTTFLKKPHVV